MAAGNENQPAHKIWVWVPSLGGSWCRVLGWLLWWDPRAAVLGAVLQCLLEVGPQIDPGSGESGIARARHLVGLGVRLCWVLWWSLEGPEVRSCVDLQAGPMRAGLVLGRSLAWFLMS
jgi:hypothetical protein